MTSHPLLPSSTFTYAMIAQGAGQTFILSHSFKERLIFALSKKAAEFFAYLPPLVHLPFLPSSLVMSISKDKSDVRKFSLIAPVMGITVATLACYKLYSISTSLLMKGALSGLHSVVMMLLSYAPPSAGALGLITLKDSIKQLCLNLDRVRHLGEPVLTRIESQSELTASIAFLVSNITLTYLTKDPIIANAVSYPLAATTKIAMMRLLSEIQMRL